MWYCRKIILLVAAAALLAGCAGFWGGGGPPRQINIVHKPSSERVQAVYYDGDYRRSVLKQINQLFRDRRTGEVHKIDPKLLDLMTELLSALALPPDTEIELTSGFRSPKSQADLVQKQESSARRSLHTTGQAADIRIKGVNGKAVAAVAQTIQGGGVAFYPKTGHIHIDTGAVRTWRGK